MGAKARRIHNEKATLMMCHHFLIFVAGVFLLSAQGQSVNSMEHKIILLSIGKIESWVLEALEPGLERTFDCQVERQSPMDVPRDAFHPARNQYNSSLILERLDDLLRPEKQDRILGIADVDLYSAVPPSKRARYPSSIYSDAAAMAFVLYQLWPHEVPLGFPFSNQRVPQLEIDPSSNCWAQMALAAAVALSK